MALFQQVNSCNNRFLNFVLPITNFRSFYCLNTGAPQVTCKTARGGAVTAQPLGDWTIENCNPKCRKAGKIKVCRCRAHYQQQNTCLKCVPHLAIQLICCSVDIIFQDNRLRA